MYYFIVNPHSGCGSGLKTWQKIEKILTRKGIEYEAFLTGSAGEAKNFAAELTAGAEDWAMTWREVSGSLPPRRDA